MLSNYRPCFLKILQGFNSQQGQEILSSKMSIWDLGLVQPTILWDLQIISLGVKQPGHGVDHSSPSTSDVKNEWIYYSALSVCLS
jgi:hypothetical protein